jgi:hypothetical protein
MIQRRDLKPLFCSPQAQSRCVAHWTADLCCGSICICEQPRPARLLFFVEVSRLFSGS